MTDVGRILKAVLEEVEHGRASALCAIVATRGSTPQPVGTMVCVDQAARMTGTLGGGCLEADIRRKAYQLLGRTGGETLTFELDHDFGEDDGMICGGSMDVAVSVIGPTADVRPYRVALQGLDAGEPVRVPVRVDTEAGSVEYRIQVEAAPELIIVGAGHISRVLGRQVVPLGFRVSVIDDRADYANAKRFAPPIQTIAGDIVRALDNWPIGSNTYVVIVTRGHKQDERALWAVLGSPARYIGMIGSRRKVAVIFNDLRHGGAKQEQLDRVRAPVGLDIGAVSVEEIALSIAAQLVSVRREGHRNVIEGPFPVTDATL